MDEVSHRSPRLGSSVAVLTPTFADRYHLTVVGATSGDTGSAAIYGLRGKKDVSVFMLHPKGRVSPIQELQMTTVLDKNVHNLAVTGNFDNCQVSAALFLNILHPPAKSGATRTSSRPSSPTQISTRPSS